MTVYRMLVVRPVDPLALERAAEAPWGVEDAGEGAYWLTLDCEAIPTPAQAPAAKALAGRIPQHPDPVFEPQKGGMVSHPRPMTDDERTRLPASTAQVPPRRSRNRR